MSYITDGENYDRKKIATVEAQVACCSDLPRQNPAILWNALISKYTALLLKRYLFFSSLFFIFYFPRLYVCFYRSSVIGSGSCLCLECPGKYSEEPS